KKIKATVTIYGDNICLSGPTYISRYTEVVQRVFLQSGFKLRPAKRVSKSKNEPWDLPGLSLFRQELDITQKDYQELVDILKRCQHNGQGWLCEKVCSRYRQKITGMFYHFKWVGTENGKMSMRASELDQAFGRVAWPDVYK